MLRHEQKEDLERQKQTWSERLARFGLRLNVRKTEYMTINLDEPSTIQDDGNDLRRTNYFKYLGSTLSADGNLTHRVVAFINAASLTLDDWSAVRQKYPGSFQDKDENVTMEGGYHACSGIGNEKIRERFGITPIADKLRKTRIRWYGHVLRANEDNIGEVVENTMLNYLPRQLLTPRNDKKLAVNSVRDHPDYGLAKQLAEAGF
ncbi:hypothetical protein Y032_0974g3262 [Ancylostoma ceylanicum]|nr:hypothetical protein Y032_0974g3262 [Ancylostoma ceylanicum]